MANTKLIYSWNKGSLPVPPKHLTTYSESLIFDGAKRTLWHKGYQYGNSYYGSGWGENFNDFLHNTASGSYSHAEGTYTTATGVASHAEGDHNTASGQAASAQGMLSKALGAYSHSEGYKTSARGAASHTEGSTTSTAAEAAHAEGYRSFAQGFASHAEGYLTQSNADYSHAEGINTVAVNDGETVVGSYNNPEDGLLFSVGNGLDGEHRSNAVRVTMSYTYTDNKAVFNNYIFGSAEYSYISHTGADKPLGSVIRALLDEADYYKPVYYTKFVGAEENHGTWEMSAYRPSYIADTAGEEPDVVYYTMEIGSYFHPGIHVYWPTVDDNITLASRMSADDMAPDYSTLPTYRTGYSYGLPPNSPVSFYYNENTSNWQTDVISANAQAFTNTLGADAVTDSYTYIMSESEYNVVAGINIPYLNSSHKLYEQLKRVGLDQISYGYANPYFDGGNSVLPHKLVVQGRYRWYAGFSDSIPADKASLVAGATGFLEKNSSGIVTECEYKLTEDDKECAYFWCACPNEYFELTDYSKRYKICSVVGNAFRAEMTTLGTYTDTTVINTYPGMDNDRFQTPYRIYSVKFNGTPYISIEDVVIRFNFSGKSALPDANYLLTETGQPHEVEESDDIILHDGIAG